MYRFGKRTLAESLTSSTFNSDRKIREFCPHHIRGPAQSHSRVKQEKVSWHHYINSYIQKYSTYQQQRRTSDSTPTEYLRLLKSVQTIYRSTKYREWLIKQKETACSQNKLTKSRFLKTIHQFQRGKLFYFSKKKKASSHTKKKKRKKIQSIFFFYFGLKDNFFFSPPNTSKKRVCRQLQKSPAKNKKKTCLLANTYANEPVGRPPRNNFSLFYSLLKLFWLTKKKYLLVWRNFKWPNLTEHW